MDAGLWSAQGIEAVSFLPEAKKIQADSPVLPRKRQDAPKFFKFRVIKFSAGQKLAFLV
jgi:hypothetical protein